MLSRLISRIARSPCRRSYQALTSPIDGVVQQLAINTVGGVVNAAQGLMVVVPHEGGIEVLAQVPSRDIGFLRPGLPVAVKLDAFDFTKYGTLDGEVPVIARVHCRIGSLENASMTPIN